MLWTRTGDASHGMFNILKCLSHMISPLKVKKVKAVIDQADIEVEVALEAAEVAEVMVVIIGDSATTQMAATNKVANGKSINCTLYVDSI